MLHDTTVRHTNIHPLEQVHFYFNLLTMFKQSLSGKYFFT